MKSKPKSIKGYILVNKYGEIPSDKSRQRYKVYKRLAFAKGKAKENRLKAVEVEITIKKRK